jgi:hypothetical protein
MGEADLFFIFVAPIDTTQIPTYPPHNFHPMK